MNLGNPIARGNTAKIYLLDNKIIKVFNDFLPNTESINEANKQKYAYSCGLPVPKIFDVTKINGKQAIVRFPFLLQLLASGSSYFGELIEVRIIRRLCELFSRNLKLLQLAKKKKDTSTTKIIFF